MTDTEANRFSARAARYARVGANVGGVAARIAGARLFGFDLDRGKNATELAAALGGLKGPIMKVAQLMATIPEALPPEYAAELPSCRARRRRWAGPSSSAAWSAELGADWQKKFASFEHQPAAAASLGQVHRAALARRRRACLQAAVSRHAVGGGGRPQPARAAVRDPPPHGPGDRHHRDRQGDRRARARGARLPARGQARRALPHHARRASTRSACRGCGRSFRPAGCSPSTGSKAAGCSSTRTPISRPATGSAPRCSRPGGSRSAASASSTATRISATTRCSRRGRRRPRGINLLDYGCIRIFPPKFVGGVVDLYNGLLQRRRRPRRARLRDLGLPRAQSRGDRRAQYLGAVHLRPAAGRPRAQPSPTASSPANTAAARRSGCTRRSSSRGRSRCRASSCSWTAPRSGSAAVFLHLRAELNFYRLFNEAIEQFSVERVAERQGAALKPPGLRRAV